MCLDHVTKRYLFARNRNKFQVGYKIFLDWDGQICSPFVGADIYKLHKTYTSSRGLICQSKPCYIKGFHIAVDLSDAIKYFYNSHLSLSHYGIYKVSYSNIVAYGIQNCTIKNEQCKTVIAKKMIINEKCNKRKMQNLLNSLYGKD